jgi:hypothetical protein
LVCNFADNLNVCAQCVNAGLCLLNSGRRAHPPGIIFTAVARAELAAMVDFLKKQPSANRGLASR